MLHFFANENFEETDSNIPARLLHILSLCLLSKVLPRIEIFNTMKIHHRDLLLAILCPFDLEDMAEGHCGINPCIDVVAVVAPPKLPIGIGAPDELLAIKNPLEQRQKH